MELVPAIFPNHLALRYPRSVSHRAATTNISFRAQGKSIGTALSFMSLLLGRMRS